MNFEESEAKKTITGAKSLSGSSINIGLGAQQTEGILMVSDDATLSITP